MLCWPNSSRLAARYVYNICSRFPPLIRESTESGIQTDTKEVPQIPCHVVKHCFCLGFPETFPYTNCAHICCCSCMLRQSLKQQQQNKNKIQNFLVGGVCLFCLVNFSMLSAVLLLITASSSFQHISQDDRFPEAILEYTHYYKSSQIYGNETCISNGDIPNWKTCTN